MNTYYQTLGLEPGASQNDIKRAYFKLIRQHSPESDPEQFQQIREAYEQLKKNQDEPEGPIFPAFSEPWAAKMLEQIQIYSKEKNYKKMRDACEEAWHKFPNEIQFLYLLITAQRRCGNTGKAVKNAELLVSKDPQNKWFQRELAISYMERGFTQKAYFACEKAYETGCRDLDFVLMFANECYDYCEFDQGVQILLEVIQRDQRWTKENVPELFEVYTGLLSMNYRAGANKHLEILERLYQFVERFHIQLKEYYSELAVMVARTCADVNPNSQENRKAEQFLAFILENCDSSDKQIVQATVECYQYYHIAADPRIGETMIRYVELFYDTDDLDTSYRKFAMIDTQLCMIEERSVILKQAEMIKKDYPKAYERIEEFIHKLESSKNLNFLKETLLKTYNRLEPMYYGGYYYELYPKEKKKLMQVNMDEFEPYVRPEKKIGRNDPCPCGSGKKYKHCCMNK